jgi:hypothetical protein
MAEFNVTINMDANTIKNLKNAGFRLYGFKAVEVSMQGGLPLVWFETDNINQSTSITWEESFSGYISNQTSPAENTIITASCTNEAVDLGQTMVIDETGNCQNTTSTGTKGAISILNKGNTQYTCGINQVVNGRPQALCAIPLFGGNLDVIMPIQKVFFMFATRQVKMGTVIVQAFSPGVLLDLTGVSERTVGYDVNKGWGPEGGIWLKRIETQASLTPLLINQLSA